MKTCSRCHVAQPRANFFSDKSRKDGLSYQCKTCKTETNLATRKRYRDQYREKYEKPASKRYYEKNRKVVLDRRREHMLKTLYGMSSADYDALLDKQEGRCAICREECATGKMLAVDHCHSTGKVRGLLCARCNRGIGNFDDSPARLRKAAKYLEGR